MLPCIVELYFSLGEKRFVIMLGVDLRGNRRCEWRPARSASSGRGSFQGVWEWTDYGIKARFPGGKGFRCRAHGNTRRFNRMWLDVEGHPILPCFARVLYFQPIRQAQIGDLFDTETMLRVIDAVMSMVWED